MVSLPIVCPRPAKTPLKAAPFVPMGWKPAPPFHVSVAVASMSLPSA